MRILHYFLGFPPYRTGGLTKYAMDLMLGQKKDGHIVMALWPGQMGLLMKSVCIKHRAAERGIENYELINPLPVPLDEGIRDFDAYMKSCDRKVYKTFLEEVKPDVIHIHTLMGLHREFIDTAVLFGIRTVFTTHDYFGICPKVTLYRQGAGCDEDHNCADCAGCNARALSLNKIYILQSPVYRGLKNSSLVKKMRKHHRTDFFLDEDSGTVSDRGAEKAEQYGRLRKYYISMLEKVDFIHFNSTVSEAVYKKYFTPKNGGVISITHCAISDNRMANNYELQKNIRITCLAPAKPFKGFRVLREALDELWKEGKRNFELHVFSPVNNPAPYMKVREDGYAYSELGSIMAETDVLAAPSIWYETFGFTVLEAVSYGVPVIVSDHVGAKDVIGEGGIIVEAGNRQQLKEAISGLDSHKLAKMREKIRSTVSIKLWRTLVDETYQIYDVG